MKIKVMAFVDEENNDFFEECRDGNGSYVRSLMIGQMKQQACDDISESDFDEWLDGTFEGFNIRYDYFSFYQNPSEALYNLDRDAYYELQDIFIDNEIYDFVEQILTYCNENDTEVYPCFGNGNTYFGTIKEIEIEIDNNQDEDCGNYEVEEIVDPPIFQLNISDLL